MGKDSECEVGKGREEGATAVVRGNFAAEAGTEYNRRHHTGFEHAGSAQAATGDGDSRLERPDNQTPATRRTKIAAQISQTTHERERERADATQSGSSTQQGKPEREAKIKQKSQHEARRPQTRTQARVA